MFTMKLNEFINLHPVFTIEEARRTCFKNNAEQTVWAELHRAERSGRIRRLKRGLYQARPVGMKAFPPPPPLLVASRLAHDAVLSHHSAFEALGASHSIFMRLGTYWTKSSRHRTEIEKVIYQPLIHPTGLRKLKRENWGVEEINIQGIDVRTTIRERTFIDSLQGLKWAGGWEEFSHCMDKLPYLNFSKVLEYLSLIDSPALNSRAGIFLERNQKRYYVPQEVLEKLHSGKSLVPVPLISGDKNSGKRDKKWNVIIPSHLSIGLKENS